MIYDVATLIRASEHRDETHRLVAEERLRGTQLEMDKQEKQNREDRRRIERQAADLVRRLRDGTPDISSNELQNWFVVDGRQLGIPRMRMTRLERRLEAEQQAVLDTKNPSELTEFLKVLLEQGKTQITMEALHAAGFNQSYRYDYPAMLANLRAAEARRNFR